jgi:hypothetical protein
MVYRAGIDEINSRVSIAVEVRQDERVMLDILVVVDFNELERNLSFP